MSTREVSVSSVQVSSAGQQSDRAEMPAPPSRLYWVDHVRTFVIVLVVHMHACVTYSHVGDWYVKRGAEPSLADKVPFIVWQAHLQSFFMGLLFFLAGYFAQGALARRSTRTFLRERSVRLGIPALLYMLVLHPFILLALNPWRHNFGPPGRFYENYVTSGKFLAASGPLWFAVALLLFCLAFASWRHFRPEPAASTPTPPPTARAGWIFAGALALVTFLVRLWLPIGTSVLNLQFCFFPQYVAFFIAGIVVARRGWLGVIASSAAARNAGIAAALVGPIVLLTLFLLGQNTPPQTFMGGWHWQAAGFAFWEQLTGVGLSLGVLSLFSRRCNVDHPGLRWLSDRSFAVYVLHAPVLVALTMLFSPLPQRPLLIPLLTLTGVAASYFLADLARRLPGIRTIL